METLRERAEAVCRAARERKPEDREEFVAAACRVNPELRREVDLLLAADDLKTQRFDPVTGRPASFSSSEVTDSTKTRSTITPTTSGSTSPTLAPGDDIGPYRIVELLGAGGMGEVYKALDPRLGRHVAVKVLSAQAMSVGFRRRFLQEARASASLNHPNIAHVYEIAEARGTCYIAMEYIDGETLRGKINSAAVPFCDLLRYLRDAANALERAHAKGIVHCDLKPDNIMVTGDGIVKVLDFGLAKLVRSYQIEDSETADVSIPPSEWHRTISAGLIEGTLGYMSPEQASGQQVIDQRSDIFSFGCLVFEAATRKLPFAADTTSATLHRIAYDPAPRVVDVCDGAPPALQDLIDHCLEKDPSKRFASMDDVARALTALIEDQNASGPAQWNADRTEAAATGSSPGAKNTAFVRTSRGQKTPPTHRNLWIIAAAAVIVLAGGVLGYRQWFAPILPPSIAVIPFALEQSTPETEYLADGISESLINDLSQLPAMKVISRGSSFRFKGQDVDVRAVAKALGVGLVVMGRVIPVGGRLHISTELVNGADGTQIWGSQYDAGPAELTMVQSRIAKDIGDRVPSNLSPSDRLRLSRDASANPQAYELVLRGRYQMRLYTPESRRRAIDYYQQALALDPAYALANAELAYSYRLLSGSAILSPGDTMPKAETVARRALASDPNLAEAHAALADILKDQWKWEEAGREYRQAIELSPNLTLAHIGYAIYLSLMGRSAEAVSEIARARELDPLGLPTAIDAAAVYYNTRRYDQALEMLRKATDLDPAAPALWLWMGIVDGGSGKLPDAIAAYEKSIGWGDNTAATMCFYANSLARVGKRAQALQILHQVERSTEFVPPTAIAAAYVGLGDKERAIQLLQRAYAIHDPLLQYIKVESHYDPLEGDPRFQELAQKIGLPR